MFTVDQAIAVGQRVLRASQQADGSFLEFCDLGPRFTAHWLALEAVLGGLSDSDREAGVLALREQQNTDGSWGPRPGSTESDPSATAAAWTALKHCGVPLADPAMVRGKQWLDQNGGIAAADAESRPLLAFTGDLTVEEMCAPPSEMVLVPGLPQMMVKSMLAEVVITMFATSGIAVGLKHNRQMPSRLSLLDHAVAARVLEYLDETRSPEGGSWLGVFPSTSMALCAMLSLGVPPSDPRVVGARASLASRVSRSGRFFVSPIGSEIWSTSVSMLALELSGSAVEDPAIVRGVNFLLAQEITCEVPAQFTTPRSLPAPRSGWPFEAQNSYGPDCDCTAMVIRTLHRLCPAGRSDIQQSIDRGLEWLLSMQNDDGGWPAFAWGHASKPPGPMMTKAPPDPRTMWQGLEALVKPPPEFGDPSTEGVTARVLSALGQLGFDGSHPAVQRAMAFLRTQQAAPGRWWGRWDCNFTATTAFVMAGMADVGQGGELLQEAITWLYACQNDDGGWGELPESYADPSAFGKGPSTPTQTALILFALVRCGHARDSEAARAAAWLQNAATHEGWIDPYPVFTVLPPAQLYCEPLAPTFLSVRALAAFQNPAYFAAPALGEVPAPPEPSLVGRLAAGAAGLAENARAALLNESEPPGDWTMLQVWNNVAYCSYAVAPETIRGVVPAELELDLFEGQAWISLVPMMLATQRVRGLPTLPDSGPAHELNVRTYVKYRGIRGVWFASVNLDLDWVVALDNLTGVRSREIAVQQSTDGGGLAFRAQRKDGTVLKLKVQAGGVPQYCRPGTLDYFLSQRLALYSVVGGRVHRAALGHAPEWASSAKASAGESTLVVADGFPAPPAELHAIRVNTVQALGWAPIPVT